MRRRPWSSLLLAALLAAPAAGCGSASSSTDGTKADPADVRSIGVPVVDPSRPTAANGSVPGHPGRDLPTTVWYPPGESRLPLVVWGHGFGAGLDVYDQYVRTIAAAGYIVATPLFPLTRKGTPGGPQFADYQNQPADVTYVIDKLLDAAKDPENPLHGRIDIDHVAIGGHSLGSITALGTAFDSCCDDPRVDAVIAVAGIELPFPNGTFSVGGGTPVLFVHGDKDTIITYDNGELAYRHRLPPKWFVTLTGEGHDPFSEDDKYRSVVFAVTLDFLDGTLRGHPKSLDRIATDGREPGVAKVDVATG